MNKIGDYIELSNGCKCLITGIDRNILRKPVAFITYSNEYKYAKIDIADYKACNIIPKFADVYLKSDQLLSDMLKVSQSRQLDEVDEGLYNTWKAVLSIVNRERNELNVEVLR